MYNPSILAIKQSYGSSLLSGSSTISSLINDASGFTISLVVSNLVPVSLSIKLTCVILPVLGTRVIIEFDIFSWYMIDLPHANVV